MGTSWGSEDVGVLSLLLGSALLACPWTGFGAVAQGIVDAMALLAGAVRHGIWLMEPVGVVLSFLGCFWPMAF